VPDAAALTAVHARAPLRISFAGGGTDVPPYPELRGGAVLSATIDLFAYASVTPTRRGTSGQFQSPDLDTAAALSGRHALVQSVLDSFAHDADVTLHCDAPPGSGLGSSSSLIVALTAALSELTGEAMTLYELAARAVVIERQELAIPGGHQDQYAAAFGGFNFIEFDADGALVTPLRLRPEVRAELQSTLLLLPTPTVQRRSSGILKRQIDAYERKDDEVLRALETIKEQAVRAKTCVLRGDLEGLGEVLREGWRSKQRLASGIATDEIEELYEQAIALGALGGKLLGAGGGGYLLLMVPFTRRGEVISRLAERGLVPRSFSFVEGGARAWRQPMSDAPRRV
jgi:D-glycero-alpha-D-manno-heptose-7-phosphate kinase